MSGELGYQPVGVQYKWPTYLRSLHVKNNRLDWVSARNVNVFPLYYYLGRFEWRYLRAQDAAVNRGTH